jgi:hypothetical protein
MSHKIGFLPREAIKDMSHKTAVVRNRRRTKAEITGIYDAFVDAAREYAPANNRQIYYVLVTRDVIPKTLYEYKRVCGYSVRARQEGAIDWDDIVDETRWVIGVQTSGSMQDYLRESIFSFRLDVWVDKPVRVRVWCESFSAAGILSPICQPWRVNVYPCRGYGSHTFIHEQALIIGDDYERGIETYCYYFGDYDPSGTDIDRYVCDTLREYTTAKHFHWQRVAVTREQIEAWSLPTAPPKTSDSRSKKFDDTRTVELEAIRPDHFRVLVEGVITQHIDEEELERRKTVEDAQRRAGAEFLDRWEKREKRRKTTP